MEPQKAANEPNTRWLPDLMLGSGAVVGWAVPTILPFS